MEVIVQYDKAFFLFLNNLGNTTWDWFWLFMTNKFYQIPVYAVLLYLLIKNKTPKELGIILLLVALLITCADQTANLFKFRLIERWRPCREPGVAEFTRLIYHRCVGNGFFSGHATNSMALAVYLTLVLHSSIKHVGFILILWATIVGYSRIYVGVHYPLDVFTGFLCGILYGYLAFLLNTVLRGRFAT